MFSAKIEIESNNKTSVYDYYDNMFTVINKFKSKFNLKVIDIPKPNSKYQFAVSLQNIDDKGWTKSICDVGFYINSNVNWTYFKSNTDDISDFTEKYNYLNELCNKYFALIK